MVLLTSLSCGVSDNFCRSGQACKYDSPGAPGNLAVTGTTVLQPEHMANTTIATIAMIIKLLIRP
jgi:hypothetical protein